MMLENFLLKRGFIPLWFLAVSAQCFLFSHRIQPYYYPFPYPVPASMLSGSGLGTPTPGSSTAGGYVGQFPIQSTPGYNYNWYNYQQYPDSGVLFPSSGSIPGAGGIANGIAGGAGAIGGSSLPGLNPFSPGGIGGSPGGFLPAPGGLLRSWWTRKMSKFGLRPSASNTNGLIGPGPTGQYSPSTSPCSSYWSGTPGSSACVSSNLCCYPLVQTTVTSSSQRPTYSSSSGSSGNGYSSSYHHGLKTGFSQQASENIDDVIESSSSASSR